MLCCLRPASGLPLEMARAVCDCCPGGSIMMTSETFFRATQLASQVPVVRETCLRSSSSPLLLFSFTLVCFPKSKPTVLECQALRTQNSGLGAHEGGVVRSGGSETDSNAGGGRRGSWSGSAAAIVYAGDHKMEKIGSGQAANGASAVQSLFNAVPTQLLGRLPHLPPVRYTSVHGLGTMAAPVGLVTIVFALVVGTAQILTDIPEAARQALHVFQVRPERRVCTDHIL